MAVVSPEAVAAHKRREKALRDGTLDARQKAAAILDALPPAPDIYWHGADGQPCACMSCSTAALRYMSRVLSLQAAGVDLEHEPKNPELFGVSNTKPGTKPRTQNPEQHYCGCGCGQKVPRPQRGPWGRYVNDAHRMRSQRQSA